MDYPRAFIIVDKDTRLPTLKAMRRWFRVEAPHKIYVKGRCASNKDLDVEIEMMTSIFQYANESQSQALRCVVVSTTEVEPYTELLTDKGWRGIAWIDSEEHLKKLQELFFVVTTANDCALAMEQAQDYFQVLVTFINRRFRQVALSDPGPAQLMHGLLDDAKTELKVQIKNLVEQHARHVVQGEESPNDRMALQAAA